MYTAWGKLETPVIILSIFSGFLLGFGWMGFFWIGAIRLVYTLHMQCLVNSLTHLGHAKEGIEDSSMKCGGSGRSKSLPGVRIGTPIIILTLARRASACAGGKRISVGTSFGRSSASVSRTALSARAFRRGRLGFSRQKRTRGDVMMAECTHKNSKSLLCIRGERLLRHGSINFACAISRIRRILTQTGPLPTALWKPVFG